MKTRLPSSALASYLAIARSAAAARSGVGGSAPSWCREVTWLGYAEKRYDRVRARVRSLLREATRAKREGEGPNGWTIEGDKVIVWEQRDAFGRRGFGWDDLPSTLIDEASSGGDRTVLYRESLEKFLGQRLRPRSRWWMPGRQ